ncbi:hypothetical protein [Amycolatopsis anabasis]|uniref:hypothetical protein n=1 Tax=Amycolatopsis anabasis TaxID=1840409 RepID=UPI00131BB0AD|nr:hypothetical protein [Amycolatopsis anabasis]
MTPPHEQPGTTLRDRPIVAISPHPEDLLPLVHSATRATLVCCASVHDYLANPVVAGFSLEDTDRIRRPWGPRHLDQLARYAQVAVNAVADPDTPVLVVPWAASPAWRAVTGQWPGLVELADISHGTVAELADKAILRDHLLRLGIPVPPYLVQAAAALVHQRITGKLGTPFLLQVPTPATGHDISLIESTDDLHRMLNARPDVTRWIVSNLPGRSTLTYQALVDTETVTVNAPSTRLSSISETGAPPGVYCGAVYGPHDHLDPDTVRAGRELTDTIGAWLAGRGYRGAFHVDYVLTDYGPHLLDLHLGPHASVTLQSEFDAERGQQPLLIRHLDAVLGRRATRTTSPAPTRPITQLELRSTRPEHTVRYSPPAGLYRVAHDRLVEHHRGLTGPPGPDSDLIRVSGAPRPGTRLTPGATLARITTSCPLTTPDGTELTDTGKRWIRAVRSVVSC